MTNVTAILSMLHEPPIGNSAGRRFRAEPVLAWTLQRLDMATQVGSVAIICWEDQLPAVAPLAEEAGAYVLAKGPRIRLASLDAISASRRWADGWRGGLLNTCDFDLGFHAPWVREVIDKLASDAIILVDPAAGLVDPKIVDETIAHASNNPNVELCFSQAAPGLGGTLLQPALVDRLATSRTHPGRLLSYLPDQPMRDPIGGDGCVPIPSAVARTTRSFKLDSDRQVARLTESSMHLNGQLVTSDAEDLLNRLHWTQEVDELPREVVLELNACRATSPIFWPGKSHSISRQPLPLETAERIFSQLSRAEDIRLTLGGVGDPLLHDRLLEIIASARQHGIQAIHLETDLLPNDTEAIGRLVESEIDVVSVHLPATTPATYAAIMGADRFTDVLENIRRFVVHRQEHGRGVPILVPTFIKCQLNLGEMEMWYDQWLKAIGAAVIDGPSTYGGLIADCGVADMSPPRRHACGRLFSRMMILSDGRIASCEQDVLARQIMGDTATQSIAEIWRGGMSGLRRAHKSGQWGPLCAGCSQWHRP